jgi:hypothetical protein
MIKRYALFATGLALILGLAGSQKTSIAQAAPSPVPATDDACSLLTVAEVGAALGIQSLPGKQAVPGNSKLCMWTDSADANISNRRLTLSITSSATAFQLMKSSPRITIEAVGGIGDEAFYELPKGSNESPVLQVRKGGAVLTLRILNGLKSKAFTTEEVKTKEALLAKAAAGRF